MLCSLLYLAIRRVLYPFKYLWYISIPYWASFFECTGICFSSSQSQPYGTRAPFHCPFCARPIITSVTRSDVSFRSNSANTRIILRIASPIALEVSNCSFSEIKVTLLYLKSSYMREKSTRFREMRSILYTITWDTCPDFTFSIIRSNAGRFVFFPDFPASSNTSIRFLLMCSTCSQ